MIWDFRPGPIKNKPQQKAAPHINQPTDFPCDSVSHENSGNKYKNSLKNSLWMSSLNVRLPTTLLKINPVSIKNKGPFW